MSNDDPVPVRGPIPPRFARRRVTIPPGTSWPYDTDEWHDALVVVDDGAVTVETLCGRMLPFARGAIIWLADLPVVALHNHGLDPVVIVAISRRTA